MQLTSVQIPRSLYIYYILLLSGIRGSCQWRPGPGGEFQPGWRPHGQVCGRGGAGGQAGQVEREGRPRGDPHQGPAPPEARLGLLHPQESGDDPGLCRGVPVKSVRVRPGLCRALQGKESQEY